MLRPDDLFEGLMRNWKLQRLVNSIESIANVLLFQSMYKAVSIVINLHKIILPCKHL